MRTISFMQALTERDHLVKRIYNLINRWEFMDYQENGKDIVWHHCIATEEYEKRTREIYGKYRELVQQFRNLDRAIVRAKGNSVIEGTFGKMSIAEAESLVEHMMGVGYYEEDGDFCASLCKKMMQDRQKCFEETGKKNRLTYGDSSFRIVDPLNSDGLIEQLEEEQRTMLADLEVGIHRWKAMTMIEVPDSTGEQDEIA